MGGRRFGLDGKGIVSVTAFHENGMALFLFILSSLATHLLSNLLHLRAKLTE